MKRCAVITEHRAWVELMLAGSAGESGEMGNKGQRDNFIKVNGL